MNTREENYSEMLLLEGKYIVKKRGNIIKLACTPYILKAVSICPANWNGIQQSFSSLFVPVCPLG
jgi:hypothetical protein